MPAGKRVRGGVRGEVSHGGRIEHDEVRVGSHLDPALGHQAELLGRPVGRLVHGRLEREDPGLSHVVTEDPRVGAVAPRMRLAFGQRPPRREHPAVRAEHRERMPHHVADVVLAHDEVDHDRPRARLVQEREQRLDGIGPAAGGDVGDRRSLVVLAPARRHPRHEGLVPLATLLGDLLREARPAGRRADPPEQRVQPPFVSPVGHDLGQRRAAGRVGVDVERDVLSALVGPLRQARRVADPAPVGPERGLVVRDLDRGARPAPRSRSPRRPRGAASAPRRGCGWHRARRPRPPPARARPPPRYRHRRPAGRPARWTARSSRPAWRRGRGPACPRARRRSAGAARIP